MEEVRAGEHPLLKETRGSPPTIAGLARSCLGAFQKCLDKAVDVHPREVTLVENQIARFSVWTANIGVFASGRGSLDHRLREAPDVQDTVGGLLEALELQAQRCLEVLDSLSPKVSEKSSEEMDLSLDQILTEIAGEISLLHKFSNTIRRASKEVHKQKAAKCFQIRDDEGNDVEDFLEQLFIHHIRDQFPEVSESIRQRLAKTMLLRRKRILYRRSRYGSKPTRTQAQPAQPVASKAAVRVKKEQNQPHEVGQEAVAAQGKAPADDTARSAVRSTAMTATTLAPDHFKKSSTPSVVSMSKTVALSSHDDLRFPPAPCGGLLRKYNKLKARSKSARPIVIDLTAEEACESGSITLDTSVVRAQVTNNEILRKEWDECVAAVGEIICPFCFCALPVAEVVNDKRWKEHVKGDLDPYVCLLEDCDCGEELYTHSNSWLKHMRDHTLKWKCKSKLHPPFEASSKQDYLDHMRTVHSGKFNDAQLGVLADKNARAAGQLFQTCPLCGEADFNGSMEDHVVGHMRFLALKSLPSYEEETGAFTDLASQTGSGSSASAQSRSTLKDYFHSGTCTTCSSYDTVHGPDELDHTVDDPESQGHTSQQNPALEQGSRFFPADIHGHGIISHSAWRKIFSRIPLEERHRYEWGFMTTSQTTSINSENDPILEEFRKAYEKGSKHEPETPKPRERTIRLDPDCSVCLRSASIMCYCEAEALDIAVAQAESRMMGPVYDEIRSWVLTHSRGSVLEICRLEQEGAKLGVSDERCVAGNDSNAYATEETKTRDQGQVLRFTTKEEKTEDEVTKGDVETFASSSVSETTTSPPTAVNQQWQETVREHPKVLDYYFSLVQLTLPPDDDPGVTDIPFSAFFNDDIRRQLEGPNPFLPDPYRSTFKEKGPPNPSNPYFHRSACPIPERPPNASNNPHRLASSIPEGSPPNSFNDLHRSASSGPERLPNPLKYPRRSAVIRPESPPNPTTLQPPYQNAYYPNTRPRPSRSKRLSNPPSPLPSQRELYQPDPQRISRTHEIDERKASPSPSQ